MTRTAKTTATVARGERVVITETGQAGTVWKLVGASRAYVNMDHGPSWSIPQADLSPEAPGEAVGEPAGEASLPSRHSPEDPQVTDEPGATRTVGSAGLDRARTEADPMTMTTDRSIPGRVYVRFGRGAAQGALVRSSTFNGAGQLDGEGVNVSAFGTLRPAELRDLARLLVEEADALEPPTRDNRTPHMKIADRAGGIRSSAAPGGVARRGSRPPR